MEKIVQQGILYDFYGELLTEHQKQVYEARVNENMSLAEIATEQGVSRQAIHDLIKRTDHILQDYEDTLGLVQRFTQIKDRIESIDELLSGIQEEYPETVTKIKSIKEICSQIKDIV